MHEAVIALALVGAADPAIWSGPPRETGVGSCVACHSVQIDERLSKPVRDARPGVHSDRGVFCHDCHGGDPAAFDVRAAKGAGAGFLGAPGRIVDEAEFCGRCHEQALRIWRESGHNQPSAISHQPSASGAQPGKPRAAAGVSRTPYPVPRTPDAAAGCLTCHGSHTAKKASTDLISPKNCGGCHGYPEANAQKTHIMQATTAILSTREQIKRFRASGGGAFAEEADLDRLRTPLRDLFHMTDRGKIRSTTQQIREESVRLSGRVKWLESGKTYRERIRWVWLAAAVMGAFVAACHFNVAFRMKKMLKRGQTGQAVGSGQ